MGGIKGDERGKKREKRGRRERKKEREERGGAKVIHFWDFPRNVDGPVFRSGGHLSFEGR